MPSGQRKPEGSGTVATPEQFAARMKALGAKAEAGVNRKIKKTALAILTELAVQTPVDTGRARSNWMVGLGGPPDDGNFPPYAAGEKGSTARANATMTIETGKAAMSDRQLGQAVYITNEVPYIEQLNNGSSAQAPAGFVQQAVQYGVAVARNEKVLA
jgi:hypothetical protein